MLHTDLQAPRTREIRRDEFVTSEQPSPDMNDVTGASILPRSCPPECKMPCSDAVPFTRFVSVQ